MAAAALRFTPTRVGNTSWASTTLSASSGSPPHAWGIRDRRRDGGPGCRFTPTRVGNTLRPAIPAGECTVHPHTRGEYYQCGHIWSLLSGSPPHAWGIPTQRPWPIRRYTVHPHTRGEYEDEYETNPLSNGSPP